MSAAVGAKGACAEALGDVLTRVPPSPLRFLSRSSAAGFVFWCVVGVEPSSLKRRRGQRKLGNWA